jgi:flagellar biosynthetic protein FlhB
VPADEAEKTEPATPKRRDDARRKGNVAQTRDLPSVGVLVTALLAGGSFLGMRLFHAVAGQARGAWGSLSLPPDNLADFHALWLRHLGLVASGVLPLMALLAAAALLVQLAQVGPLFSFEALQPKGERLDPIQGLKRMVNLDRLVELAKAGLKIAVVGGLAWWLVGAEVDSLLGLSGASLAGSLGVAGTLARRVALVVLGALAVMAAFDFVYQRWRWEQRLRMSKQEVRDELKQREGNPQIRSRFRSRQLELTRQRMIASVSEADVVVTNPTRYAVALRYERTSMSAPRVLAKGRGYVAQRIRAEAERAGVPIVENPPLARALHRTAEVGRDIPEALFQTVAEVLAFVYRLRPGHHRGWRPAS